jgi:hypothetical protein
MSSALALCLALAAFLCRFLCMAFPELAAVFFLRGALALSFGAALEPALVSFLGAAWSLLALVAVLALGLVLGVRLGVALKAAFVEFAAFGTV